jgi:uncharacterized OsmC-like protein
MQVILIKNNKNMFISKVEYLGNLRTKCTHIQSGTEIITDAPIDNNGKGESFSPTDLVATSYASCMMTIIGIYCEHHGLKFLKATAGIKKIMADAPRRISEIKINLDLSGNNWNEEEQKKIINAAKACPVAKSIHENILIDFDISF